jgi:hypothetical protein
VGYLPRLRLVDGVKYLAMEYHLVDGTGVSLVRLLKVMDLKSLRLGNRTIALLGCLRSEPSLWVNLI